MAEPIEMLFGLIKDSCGPREPCVRWGPDPPWERAILRGKGRPIVKYRYTLHHCMWSSVQKMAEPIQMPFGLWARMGLRKESSVRCGSRSLVGRGKFGGKGCPL